MASRALEGFIGRVIVAKGVDINKVCVMYQLDRIRDLAFTLWRRGLENGKRDVETLEPNDALFHRNCWREACVEWVRLDRSALGDKEQTEEMIEHILTANLSSGVVERALSAQRRKSRPNLADIHKLFLH